MIILNTGEQIKITWKGKGEEAAFSEADWVGRFVRATLLYRNLYAGEPHCNGPWCNRINSLYSWLAFQTKFVSSEKVC